MSKTKSQNENDKLKIFVPLNNSTKKPSIKQIKPQFCEESMDNLPDAGIVLPKDCTFIDFDGHNKDEKKYIESLKAIFPTNWLDTDRGSHFYFKKPINHKIYHQAKRLSTCGLVYDFCCPPYAVIKRNGVIRQGTWNFSFDNIPILPDWLLPFPKKDKDETLEILGLVEGDGRKVTLLSWMARVHARLRGINTPEIFRIINTIIFKEQLPLEELQEILQKVMNGDYSFDNTGIGSIKQSQNVANWLISQFNVKFYKGKIWHKDGLRYISEESLLAGKLNKKLDVNKADWEKILFKLYIDEDIRIPDDQNNFIRIDNGVILNGLYGDLESDEFTPYYLPICYDPDVYDEEVDKFLNWLSSNDRDMRNVIEEMFGHVILTENAPHAFFLITGDADNGKSTFLNMIQRFVKGLCSSVNIKNFQDPNSIVKMTDKLVNIDDDIDPDYLENSKTIKCIASGDGSLEVKTLFKDKTDVVLRTTLIFTANKPPTWKDKSQGLYRRLNIIHLDNVITDKDKDHELLEKLSTNNAKQYILKLALEGVQRFKKNNMKVSFCQKAKDTKDQYMIDSDPVLYWKDETGVDLEGQSVTYTTEQYNDWAIRNGCKTIGVSEFGRRLKNMGYRRDRVTEGNKRPWKIFKL
jgi:putative DNA primase/helicase